MKVTTEISPEILDNKSLFDTEFFNRFSLSPHTLILTDEISKSYQFPTLYGNVRQSVGIFFCAYDKAKKMMPENRMKPVKMGGDRSLVIFSCYTYRQVHQIGGYNEIAMTIPVMTDTLLNPPVIPMLMGSKFSGFGYYVFSMPVTSLENKIRGHKLWGLPKVVQNIQFTEENGLCVCRAEEENGDPYFSLTVPMNGKTETFDESGDLYSKLDSKLLKSKTCFRGDYQVNKYMGRLVGSSKVEPHDTCLRVWDTESGRVLKDLEIDPRPFQFRYSNNVSSCFDLADSSFS